MPTLLYELGEKKNIHLAVSARISLYLAETLGYTVIVCASILDLILLVTSGRFTSNEDNVIMASILRLSCG